MLCWIMATFQERARKVALRRQPEDQGGREGRDVDQGEIFVSSETR